MFGLTLLGVASAALLVTAGRVPLGAATSQSLLAVIGCFALGSLALLWLALDRRLDITPLAAVFGLALLLRLIAVQAWPLLEDDYFRYLWDGFRTATTLDPYRVAPSVFFGSTSLPPQWQDILGGINHPDVPTIYGPLLQWFFAVAYWVAPGGLGGLQGLLLLADMALLWTLHHHGVGRRWLLAYAVHPLVLNEAMASAHPDGLVALCLLWALRAWQGHHALRAGALLGLAMATKIAALVALPLLLLAPTVVMSRRAPPSPAAATPALHRAASARSWAMRIAAGMLMALALLYLPFVIAGSTDVAALLTFGRDWRFNPLLYRWLEWAVPTPWAKPLAALLIVASLLAMALWSRRIAMRAGSAWRPPLELAIVALLLWAPVVNPWYWLWGLALAVAARRTHIVVIGTVAWLSYLNSTVLPEAGWWGLGSPETPFLVSWPIALLQVFALALAGGVDWVRTRRQELIAG